jgi:hypothetical protein
MSRTMRTILGIVAAALFLCCVAGLGLTLLGSRLFTKAVVTDPTRVAAIGSQIVSYSLPVGLAEMFASDVLGFKVIAIGPTDPDADLLIIMLMQMPATANVDQDDLRQQMETALTQQTGVGSADLHIVGTQQATILDQDVTLTVREGSAGNDQTLRQISGLFTGPNGLVFMFVTGAAASWNQPRLDQFLASIH